MKTYDVGFYNITIKAESEIKAIEKVNMALDSIPSMYNDVSDILDSIRVEFADLICDDNDF